MERLCSDAHIVCSFNAVFAGVREGCVSTFSAAGQMKLLEMKTFPTSNLASFMASNPTERSEDRTVIFILRAFRHRGLFTTRMREWFVRQSADIGHMQR